MENTNNNKMDVYASFVEALNKLREEHQGEYLSLKEVKQKLQLVCPFRKLTDTNFRYFKETGILVKAGKYYCFPTEPIYLGKVKKAFELATAKANEYNHKSRNNHHKEIENKKEEINSISENDAITFLKSLGYKIYKPNVSYEEI